MLSSAKLTGQRDKAGNNLINTPIQRKSRPSSGLRLINSVLKPKRDYTKRSVSPGRTASSARG